PMGGVINFLVKKPQTKPYLFLQTKGGSFSTNEGILELGGKLDNLSYLFNIARLDTEGFSKAKEKNNSEDDPYQNTNILLNLNYNSSEKELELGFITKAIHSRNELDDDDDYDGIPEDDDDNISWNNELINTLFLKKKLTDILSYKLQLGYTSIYRKSRDSGEEYVRDWYKGKTYQFLSNIEINPLEIYKIILGFDYIREKAESKANYSGYRSSLKQTNHTKGFFWENIFVPFECIKLEASIRREQNPFFKYHSALKGGISYKIPIFPETEIYLSYSEGFKAPSIYQLYSPSGNRGLKPEESQLWEAGFSQPIGKQFSLSFSYFHSNCKNLIDFVYIDPSRYLGRYENATKSKSRGIELEINYKPNSDLELKVGYDYLKGEQDFVDGDIVNFSLVSTKIFRHPSIRIPKHRAFLVMEGKVKKINFSFNISYIGKRTDRIWKTIGFDTFDEFAIMKPYILSNIIVHYNLWENISLFMNINNILNKDYEKIKGYQEEKRSIYGGIKIKF
ncbi:MAG: TonB-dependent receptor, partial [Candidatus Omnitrophica bacterium]|nr:TonB-dependent receptor [Candidatus Omnitrophota bacterium]